MTDKPLIEMKQITKSYGGIRALKWIDFHLYQGEVRALLGENGAGKSTLMKILSGAESMDSGEILVNGETVSVTSPKRSRDLGISTIYQEFILAPQLSVAENIFLDRLSERKGLICWKALCQKAGALLKQMGFENIDPMTKVGDLPVAYQQIVEICKALSREARVLILDEPTAVLTFHEIEKLFQVIRKLRDEGWGIIYISHRLEEVFQICDRATILKDGTLVGAYELRGMEKKDLVNLMVGRTMQNYYPPREVNIGQEVLRAEHLKAGSLVDDVSFHVRAGEVLGFYGLVGAGRTETMRALFGADVLQEGEIQLEGNKIQIRNPSEAVKHGIGLLPEDRKKEGVLLKLPIRWNTTLSNIKTFSFWGIHNHRREQEVAQKALKDLHTKYGSLEDAANSLSGGNQQKVALAKWLVAGCKVVILDEPTRGVDIGAKREIYSIINELARAGTGIVVVSSEMEEIMNISDWILVMRCGKITGELKKEEITEQRLIQLAMGVS